MSDNKLAFNNAFCPLLFIHQHINTNKEMRVCCFSTVHGKVSDNHDFNSVEYKTIRDNSLRNEWSPQCVICKTAEENKELSYRQFAIKDFRSHKDLINSQVELHKSGKDIQPYFYDLRISNLCNLMCQTCEPSKSSSIAKSLNQDLPFLTFEPEVDVNPNAIKIYLAGGEPFMIKKFIKILKQVENLDCEVVVNTNGTIINEQMLAALKRFKNVNITLSLDGYSTLNDKIRKGSNWNVILRNLQIFKDCGFSIHVNTVLQKDNVNELYDLGKFLEEQSIFKWSITELLYPEEFKWEHATVNKTAVMKILELDIIKNNIGATSMINKILK